MNKDPHATLDFKVDWAAPKSRTNPDGPWLADGETIATSTWTVTPVEAESVEGRLVTTSTTHTDTAATIWLSGGVASRYMVTNRITTSEGRQDERTFPIDIRNR